MYSSDKGFNTHFSPQRASGFAMISTTSRQMQSTLPVSSWGGGQVQSTGCSPTGRGRAWRRGGCFSGFCRQVFGFFGRLFGGGGCGRRGGDDGEGCDGPICRNRGNGRNINDNQEEVSPQHKRRGDKAPPKTPFSEEKKSPQRKGAPSQTDLSLFLAQINALRKSRGLGAVAYDDKLNKASEKHAQDMARHGNMSHRGSDGSSFTQRMQREGCKRLSGGENVAMGSQTAKGVFSQWFHSSGHLANMLNPNARKIGLGKDGVYWGLIVS